MHREILYEDANTQWIFLGRDPSRPEDIIDTNEYVIISDGKAMILDPGGTEIFPTVLTAVSEVIPIQTIQGYLCSHQDPDIMSSLPLWMTLTPDAKVYLSWLWSGFVSHFGHDFAKNFVSLPDEGMSIELGKKKFEIVPAHHCHSPGNFNLFDPRARILFSGDVGAALLPPAYPLFVEDFSQHIQFIEGFHKRWMSSNTAKNDWVKRVRQLNPRMICPQHGAIFRDENVGKFLDWFEALEVGSAHKNKAA